MDSFGRPGQRYRSQAELFWEQTRQSSRLATVVALVSCAVLWPFVEPVPLIAWGLMALVLSQGRIYLLSLWLKRNSIEGHPARFLNLASYSMIFPGIVWMSLVFLYIPADNDTVFLIVLFLVAGMVSNSLTALSSSIPAYICFIMPPAIALITVSLLDDKYGLAILLVLSVGGLISMARKNNRFINRAITLDLHNQALLDDVTKAKTKVEHINASKSRFLAGISHDLRQPLQALSIYLDLLKPYQKEEKSGYLIDQANHAHNELSDTFNSLLDLSRLETSDIEVKTAAIDLLSLCTEQSKPFLIMAQKKGLQFHLKMEKAFVHTDRLLLTRIVNNLVTNAIKYTEHGSVSLSGSVQGAEYVINVQDTGPGIDPAYHAAVFKDYYQVAPNQRQNGVGLGLSLALAFCNRLGTSLTLKSELGIGSVFSFSLPLISAEALAKNDENHLGLDEIVITGNDNPIEDVEPGLLTFIEDNAVVTDAIKRLFIEWHWTVEHFESFEQWSATEKTVKPNLVISDFDLSDNVDGIDTIRLLREHWQEPLPAIILTGRSDHESLKKIKQANIFPLIKPVKLPHLQMAIKQIVH